MPLHFGGSTGFKFVHLLYLYDQVHHFSTPLLIDGEVMWCRYLFDFRLLTL